MNESTFHSQRTHTRVKFSPLTKSCTLSVLTPDSPAAQIYDSTAVQEFAPNRLANPTVIYPLVRAYDPDGIFPSSPANVYLSLDTLQWLVNGEPIEDVWDAWDREHGDYEIIQTSDEMRGAIRIYKNVDVGETFDLKFRGSFIDIRTGLIYPVESSNTITLLTTESGEDVLSCNIDKASVEYDPIFDDLLLYEYKVANDIPVTGSRSDHINGKCYEQLFTVALLKGSTALVSLPSGITMRLVRLINGETSIPLTANSENAPEVMQISYPYVKLDMRQIDHSEYEVQFIENNTVIEACRFTAQTKVSMPASATPAYGADLPVGRTLYTNEAIIALEDRIVQYPELYYLIQWYTQTFQGGTGSSKTWQLGSIMEAETTQIGFGYRADNSYFDVWFDVNPQDTATVLTDEFGEALLDENDEFLLD